MRSHFVGMLIVVVSLGLTGSMAYGTDTYWQGAAGTPLPWTAASNWTNGVPVGGPTNYANNAYISNSGIATISVGNSQTAPAFKMGTGTTGGQVSQSGGYLELYSLNMNAGANRTSLYTMTGGSLLVDSYDDFVMAMAQIAGTGTNTFHQSGGTWTIQAAEPAGEYSERYWGIDAYLLVGADDYLGHRAGRYELSGTGQLLVPIMGIGTLGYFDQSGGSVTTDFFSQKGTWKFTGGTFSAARGLVLAGTVDFNSTSQSLTVGDAVADFSQGATFLNSTQASFSSGPKSLVLLPPYFDSAAAFGGGWNPGNLIHTTGTDLTLTATQSFEGWGDIDDHVNCAGSIDAGIADLPGGYINSKGLNLNQGLNITGNGTVNLQLGNQILFDIFNGGTLTVSDLTSGMTSGSLVAEDVVIGTPAGAGTFTQSAGSVILNADGFNYYSSHLFLSCGSGAADGTYVLNGGTLLVQQIFAGWDGRGYFTQTSGSCDVIFGLDVGYDTTLSPAEGHYNLSGGVLNTPDITVFSGSGIASTFVQSGGTNTVSGLLQLGAKGGQSSYVLSGTGVLTYAASSGGTVGIGSTVNDFGQCTFAQSGGTCAANTVVVDGFNKNRLNSADSNRNAHYLLQGGALTVSNSLKVDGRGTAIFDQTGGSAVVGDLRVAPFSGYYSYVDGLSGVYNLSGTGTLNAASEKIGTTGTGTFNQTGGSNTASGQIILGEETSSAGTYYDQHATGTYNLSGANSQLHTANLWLGQAKATGQFTQTDGTATVSGSTVVGYSASGVGTYEISGGVLNTLNLTIGRDSGANHGTGTFKVTNAAACVQVSGVLHLGVNGSFSAVPGTVVYLSGATLENASTTPSNAAGLSNARLVFEGGPGVLDTFEVASRDNGTGSASQVNNFALGTLQIGGARVGRLQLVDLVDNQPGYSGSEVLYVQNLILGPGSYLDLNHLKVYYGTLTNTGGTINLNGGSLVPLTSYSGTETGSGGTINLSNSGPYTYGQVITVTASAQAGYLFSGWSVTGASTLSNSTALSTSLTVYDNFTLTANFTVRPLGDINGDGVVDEKDLAILNARLNGFDISPYTAADCDLNHDGHVTTADRVILRRILNGPAP
jgi:hypothetical protein